MFHVKHLIKVIYKFVSRETIELNFFNSIVQHNQGVIVFSCGKQILVFKFVLNNIVSRETINKS